MGNDVKLTRDNLVKLRTNLIKYLPTHKSISKITETLISHPTLFSLKHSNWYGCNHVKRSLVSEGHGAFGESENSYSYYVTDINGIDHNIWDDSLILVSNDDKVLGTLSLNLHDIGNELEAELERVHKEKKKHIIGDIYKTKLDDTPAI